MKNSKIARRGLMLGSLALMVSGCLPSLEEAGSGSYAFPMPPGPDPRFRRQHVKYDGSEEPGTIVVNVSEFFLYAVEEGGWATRYGVAVGEKGLTFKGEATIGRKEN